MTLSVSFLDELRVRTNLSALVGKTVKLTKAGNEMKGCCPFHNEKTPSFYVNDSKGFYHCFGCSAHGDAIRWLTDQKGLPFMDAVRELADAAGMEVPAHDPAADARAQEREQDIVVMERAAAWFQAQLKEWRGVKTREYLAERMVPDEVAAEFGLGYSPPGKDSLELCNTLKDVSDERKVELGLMRKAEGKDPHDYFRSRLMFPIHDSRGRVIGFGARAMGDGQPKYLNSPQTRIFDKGRTLFNLHRAAPAARRANRIIVVEGYMDVIAMWIAGIRESVAPNGTALTEAQLAQLWRHADTPILCFDGDEAGRKAAGRAALRALPMLEPGKSLSFAFPPPGSDPDDVLRRDGAAAVAAMFDAPEPLVEVIWRKELTEKPITTPEMEAGLYTRLQTVVGTIRHPVVRESYGAEILTRFNALRAGRGLVGNSPKPERAAPRADDVGGRSGGNVGISTAIEAAILLGMMKNMEIVRAEFETVAQMAWGHDEMRRAAGVLVDLVIAGSPATESDISVALEAAGIPALRIRLESAARVPFSFVNKPGSREAHDDLTAAIYQLAR